MCTFIGYKFVPHGALEDAKAAAQVWLAAVKETQINPKEWLECVRHLVAKNVALDGNPAGPLHGETLVFTGALARLRTDAAMLASRAGCRVGANVTKETTILVAGDEDLKELAGYEKVGSKERQRD